MPITANRLLCFVLFVSVLAGCQNAENTEATLPLKWPPKLWSARRLTAQDTLVHAFIRSLLAQAQTQPGPIADQTFYLSKTLYDQLPGPIPRCANCANPDLSDGVLSHLVTRDRLLTAADTLFMYQQMRSAFPLQLTQLLLPECRIVPVDTMWAIGRRLPATGNRPGYRRYDEMVKQLRARYHTAYFCSFSLPLFSLDRKIAIVDISYYFGVDESGITFVFYKEKHQWKILRQLQRRVS